jgi:hypothetical protein
VGVCVWQRRSFWLALAATVALAACGTSGPTPSPASVPEQATQPGLEGIGPLPEYRLNLALDPEVGQLTGSQEVTVPNRSSIDLYEIVFRLYPNLPQYGGRLRVDSLTVDGGPGTAYLRADDTSLVVPLARPLPPGSVITIGMGFEVEIPDRPNGYILFGHSQGIWSLPDTYAVLAVHDGSAWHEGLAPPHGDAVFADSARYQVTLTLPGDLVLATTGTVAPASETAEDGLRTYQVTGSPIREFTFLASADYLSAETQALGVTVRSFYLPGDEAAGHAALNTAAALRVYSDAFGAYPYSEMIVVEAPLRFYGMEYPGLNLIGLDLYHDERQELETRVAHEIAHQWWYGQVGSDPVNRPWLDEGLTENSVATYIRQVYGEAQANTYVNQQWLVPYQLAVENGQDAVVNQPAAAFGPEYEVMVYAKAALFFDALRQQVGEETYREILRQYLARFRWRIATPDDFLRVAESVSGQDLDALYSRWILGTR